jgi:hypothetical protein
VALSEDSLSEPQKFLVPAIENALVGSCEDGGMAIQWMDRLLDIPSSQLERRLQDGKSLSAALTI